MSSDLLLRKFEQIAEAPNAVPQMRRLVFCLAVRGKLVDRDVRDQPASDLVGQICAARRTSQLKRSTGMATSRQRVENGDVPFGIPAHWLSLPLLEVGALSGGMTPSKSRGDFWGGEINWLSPKDIKSDDLGESELKITAAGAAATGLQIYPPGCLFMVARSGILKRTFPVGINRLPATANQDMKVLKPFVGGLERYLQIAFKGMTDFILDELVKTGTTVQSLKYDEFERLQVPIPPLAEQRRIVAKVDELMTLCDRLEAAQAERERRRDSLAAASLGRWVATGGEGRDAHNEVKFYVENASRLITHPRHLPGVRNAIFELALTGRLVKQIPSDGDAKHLVEAALRAREQALGSKPRSRAADTSVPTTTLPTIPPTWSWARLDSIAAIVGGVTIDHNTQSAPGLVEVPYLRVANVQRGYLDLQKIKTVRVTPERLAYWRLLRGDALLNEGGDRDKLGRGWIWEGQIDPCIHQNHVFRARQYELILDPRLLMWQANTFGQQWFIDAGRQTTNLASVSKTRLSSFPVPIPPLAEQRRIVSKVDQLLAVCDELERNLDSVQLGQARLLNAVLYEALADHDVEPERVLMEAQ